jgi:uncharacterized protein YndB with AHSA1/START domain
MEQKNETENRELTITRLINAPREIVWEAWTNPKHLAQWWGPKGYTNPLCEWEVKPGNKILVHMQAPDGTVHPMDGMFHEIVKPEKLVFTAAALDENGERLFEVLNTVTFTVQNEKTKLTIHASVSKIRNGSETHLAGMNEGWNQSIDKLEELLVEI